MAQTGQAERLRSLVQMRARKASDRPARLPQPKPVSAPRAAANAIGRVAERLYRMPVLPVDIQPGVATVGDLPELLPDGGLLTVLQGPGDRLGVMALDFEAVTALIEAQALGRVTARPAERRRVTRSDAAICVDFINAVMTELVSDMAGVEGFGQIEGYRYATHLDDPRPLVLMLDDRPFRSLSLDLRFGDGGQREGRIFIALPQGTEAVPVPAAASALSLPDAPAVPRTTSLAATVTAAPIEVMGVLCRRKITLGELRALVPGRVLALPRVGLGDAQLETRTGQVLAAGKLGESAGCYAIRLHDPSRTPSRPAPGEGGPDMVLPPADLAEGDPFRAPGGLPAVVPAGFARLAPAG